jgi:hypothetical protein
MEPALAAGSFHQVGELRGRTTHFVHIPADQILGQGAKQLRPPEKDRDRAVYTFAY